jgi:predicted N-acetyltransferase YhbS
MRSADIDAVLAVQRAAYGDDYQEAAEVLLDKWRAGSAWCHVAELAGQCVGYVLSHPWRHDRVPPLHRRLELPAQPDCLFLHDLAVAPSGRGHGLGAALLRAVHAAAAPSFTQIKLVSLGDATGFWLRNGFKPVMNPCEAAELSSYGEGACHMSQGLVMA